MTWCWQNKIALLLNANKMGKLHKLDAIFGPSDLKQNVLETIWRNVEMKTSCLCREAVIIKQQSIFSNCHTTQQEIYISWKETWRRLLVHVDPGRGRATTNQI